MSLLIACLSFPFLTLFYLPGIDGSLPWVFNYFAAGHFELGQHVIFPHGPLAFLLYPLNMDNNLPVYIALRIAISFALSYSLFSTGNGADKKTFVLPFLISLLIHAIADVQMMLFVLAFLQVYFYTQHQKKFYLLAAVAISVFNLYVKSYGGMISLLLLFSTGSYFILRHKEFKTALILFGNYLLLFLLLWLALYKSLSGSFDFLRGQIELSADNSEAVSFYQVNNWWWIAVCLIAYLLVPLVVGEKNTRIAWLLLLAPLFGAWKHAMSRGDNPHISGFLSVLTIFFLLFWLLTEESNFRILISGVVSISAFTINMASTAKYNDFAPQQDIALLKPYNFIRLFDSTVVSKRISDSTCYAVNKSELLPDTIKKLVRKATVDVFPCNQSIIAINRLNWSPRPSLHSYASYTNWLDKKNAAYYGSERAADFIIWQIDIFGGKLASIDQRYLLNDAPEAMLEFFRRYSLVYQDSKFLIYKKEKTAREVSLRNLPGKNTERFDHWITVPACDSNEILRLKLNIYSNFKGKLKSFFYKGVSFSINYELENGQKLSHKIVPKNAEAGLWISPFILAPQSQVYESKVKRVQIICWEKDQVVHQFEYSFEAIRFSKEVTLQSRLFGKARKIYWRE